MIVGDDLTAINSPKPSTDINYLNGIATMVTKPNHRARRRVGASSDFITDFLIAIFAILGLFVVLFRDRFIPANFSYDGLKIQAIANQDISSFGDPSYQSVAWIYGILGLGTQPIIASVLGYTLFLSAIILVRQKFPREQNQGLVGGMYAASIILGAVYLGYYSKDVFVTPIMLLAIATGFSRRSELLLGLAMVAYALNFRTYWALVLLIFMAYRRLAFLNRGRIRIFFVLTLSSIALSVIVTLVFKCPPDYFREIANLTRFGSADATTAIPSFVNFSQPYSGTVNNLLTFWLLFVPLPLVALGQLVYVAIFLAISSIWCISVISISKMKPHSHH